VIHAIATENVPLTTSTTLSETATTLTTLLTTSVSTVIQTTTIFPSPNRVLPNCYNTYPTFALQVTSNDPNFAYQGQYAAQGTADTYIHAFTSDISAANKFFLDYYGLLISNVLGPGRGAIPYTSSSGGGGIVYVGAYSPGVQVLQCEIPSPVVGAGVLSCSDPPGNYIFQ